MLGQRHPADLRSRFTPPAGVDEPEAWLAAREAAVPDLRPGLEKQILWHDPHHRGETDLSLVYIHGFSASKGETRPVPDAVAKALGANLFFTRLAGHGADGAALGRATAQQWLDDTAEALWIGSRIGRRTIVMATSTGATLLTSLLADPALSGSVAAAVLIAPNFGLKARGASLLTLPFAGLIVDRIVGRERIIEPVNAANAALWTLRYPARALLPMAALVKSVARLDVGRIRTPAFFYYAGDDRVVDAAATDRVLAAWGGPVARAAPGPVEDVNRHVIAGDALAPSGTAPAVAAITGWLRTTLGS